MPARLPYDQRLQGLSPTATSMMREVRLCLQRNEVMRAGELLTGVIVLAPDHPEVLRLNGLQRVLSRRPDGAVPLLERSLELRPDDPSTLNELAGALYDTGNEDRAFAAWRRACSADPGHVAPLLNLGKSLKKSGRAGESIEPLERALALAPEHLLAREIHADALITLGRFDAAIDEFHEMLRRKETAGAAWWGLAKIKTRRLADSEFERLARVFSRGQLPDRERMPMAFALGKAYEDRQRFDEAFATYRIGNELARRLHPWDAAMFSRRIDAILDAAYPAPAPAAASDLGGELIFIVSLPRAGSTLTEQILSAHSEVEGAGELNDITGILQEESIRRRREFPAWIPGVTAAEWRDMGQRYLQRTRRWREHRPRSTDKLPNNWLFLGAIRAMLPAARIINCVRDPVETCWSCYKELFYRGGEFTYAFSDLGAFWRDYDRAMRHWHESAGERLREQSYEALIADPETEIRGLLAFCDLAFDEACLSFHESGRAVDTASAAQVRQPLRKGTARTPHYGALLDPLRSALAATS